MGEGASRDVLRRAQAAGRDAPGLTDQIGFKLRMAQNIVWADLTATFAPFDLKPHQYAALLIISDRAGCKQQDIGEIMGVFRSNLVALVDDLWARGLVERTVRPEDRRSYALTLTKAGKTLMPQLNAVHAEHQARIARALAPHDPVRLCDLLDLLLTSDLAIASEIA